MTRRNRRAIATVCGLAAVLAMAACTTQAGGAGAQAGAPVPAANGEQAPNGLDPNAPNNLDPNSGLNPGGNANGETTADSAPSGASATLIAKQTAKMGPIVTLNGKTVYVFDKDGWNPAKPNCDAPCLAAWPIVESAAIPQLQGIDPALVGTVITSTGKQQVTLKGKPLYTFAKDDIGTWRGQANKDVWFVVRPDGNKNLECLPKGSTGGRKDNGGDAAPSNNTGDAAKPPATGGNTGGYNY